MLKSHVLIFLGILLLSSQAMGSTVEIKGGWDISGEGQTASSGANELGCYGSDPSITLGIASNSYVFGPGKSSETWQGSQDLAINLAGFRLEAAYDGKVESSVILTSQGSASSTAFVGASASGISTGYIPTGSGGDSYDIFGSADITTEGFINGQGTASASASGSASYDSQKPGTSSEVWGKVAGSSTLAFESGSSKGMVSTSGTKNGLHSDSRVTRSIQEDISAIANGQLTSYASIVNKGNANINTLPSTSCDSGMGS